MWFCILFSENRRLRAKVDELTTSEQTLRASEARLHLQVDSLVCTVGHLSFGPIEKILCFVTSACVKRTGAASQAFERMHNT